ncbi:alpha/beta hydrolase [Rhodococcus kronopolitis]|uniref:Alpha/beta hydrolase n=1 Tax=Rhodococcus kronopolitis TaxID=1460226 RepID=A0ABV9FT19_9NOCA
MTTLAHVRTWRPDALAAAGRAVAESSRAFAAAVAAVESRMDTAMGSWRGSAATAAAARVASELESAQRVSAAATAQAAAFAGAAAALGPARSAALTIADAAHAAGFHVADDGRVRAPTFVSGHPVADLLFQAQLSERARAFEARLVPALTTAVELDAHAGAALDAATARLADLRGGRATPARPAALQVPPAHGTAADNRKFWDSLTPGQQRKLVSERPDWVGDRDGLPAYARHAANVRRFADERARLVSERGRLRANLDGNLFGGAFTDDDAALWYTERKLADLDGIEAIVASNPDGLLLLLDLRSGERGMAAFAVGNPDTADHIAVTTPGLNTTVGDSLAGMVDEATELRSAAESKVAPRGETVACIAWLGYEPPQTTGPGGPVDVVRGLTEVAQPDRAAAGAVRLAGFYDGLSVASRRPDPHLTALGHSYGSLTTGLALQDPSPGQPVDDAVFYGSPGVNAGDESDLGLADGHAYVMEADGDRLVTAVGRTHLFGPDPGRSDFEQLAVHAGTGPDGVARDGAHSHGQYSQPGDNGELRMSGYNMAMIVAGLPELAVRR